MEVHYEGVYTMERDVPRYAMCWWLLLPKARGGCIKLGKGCELHEVYEVHELIIVLMN